MSMVQQLISAVSDAQRQIDQQMAQLRAYSAELDQAAGRIENALSGSTQSYGLEMLQQLTATKTDIHQSLDRLELAKQKLQSVKMM